MLHAGVKRSVKRRGQLVLASLHESSDVHPFCSTHSLTKITFDLISKVASLYIASENLNPRAVSEHPQSSFNSRMILRASYNKRTMMKKTIQ